MVRSQSEETRSEITGERRDVSPRDDVGVWDQRPRLQTPGVGRRTTQGSCSSAKAGHSAEVDWILVRRERARTSRYRRPGRRSASCKAELAD